jgi:alkylation response protein AidB-like acyl-CoA dehydrogenase
LTYFLINMKSQGVSHRPLRQITGDSEFNEVFFDRVFVPEDCVVGAVGEGWKIAISTLMYERVVLTFARQLQSEVLLRSLLSREHDFSAGSKRELAHHLATACAVRALAYEHLDAYVRGAAPGPEGSMDKLLWSESFQELSRFAVQVRGLEAVAHDRGMEGENVSDDDFHRYLYSRGRTIAAGTSEIQRSIIAERVLGLPRLSYSRAG